MWAQGSCISRTISLYFSSPELIPSFLCYCMSPSAFLLCRQKLHPIPGLPSVSGRMLLLSLPGDGLVLGGGQRGCGGAEAQPPERHSHPRATGEEWTSHHHRPPGTGLRLLPPIGKDLKGDTPPRVIVGHPPLLSLFPGRIQPGAVRPAACGVVSGMACCGPRLADSQPLLGW